MLWFLAFHLWRSLNPCLETETIFSNGAHIHVDIYDCSPAEEKDTLVFLHGGGASLDSYYKQIPSFTGKFRVIAIDARGHGRSTDDPNKPLSHSLMVNDVKNVMEALNIQKAHFVGWSEGAIIAQTLAFTHPHFVDRLVLIASIFHIDGYTKEAVERLKNATADNWEPDAKDLYQAVAPDPEYWPILFAKARDMWLRSPVDSKEDMGRIKSPTLVLAADHDEYIQLDHIKELAAAIPKGQLVVFENSDHMLPVKRPHQVNRVISDFLK